MSDRSKARLDWNDGRTLEGTVPWANKGWTLLRYNGELFRHQYKDDDGYELFHEAAAICEDFEPVPSNSEESKG